MEKRIIAMNKKAFHEFFIEDTYECGIVLAGTEVKSIRGGKVNLKEAYAEVRNGEMYVCGMHVSPYDHGNIFNKDAMRDRKLLLHKREILRLYDMVRQKGVTLVPTEIYFLGNKVKLTIAVAVGKKLYDKRDVAAKKESDREIDRRLKGAFS